MASINPKTGLLTSGLKRRVTTMYEISVYSITPKLWRWELRCGGALLRCGTAPTRAAAERK